MYQLTGTSSGQDNVLTELQQMSLLDHLNAASLNARTRWLTQAPNRLSRITACHSATFNRDLLKLDRSHLHTHLLSYFPPNDSSLCQQNANLKKADIDVPEVFDNRHPILRDSDPLYGLRTSLRRATRTHVKSRIHLTRLVRVRDKLRDHQEIEANVHRNFYASALRDFTDWDN